MNFKTNDIKKIGSILNKVEANTLIIFDVDEVLFHASDQILKSKHHLIFKEYYKILEEALPLNQIDEYISIIWKEHKTELVNERFPIIIQNLQQKAIKTLALTACIAGRFGCIDSIEDWRFQDLKNYNYDFRISWPGLDTKIFNQFVIDQLGSYTTYEKGVAYAGSISKGKILKAFLEYANYMPKKIIFIDDLMVNIESVELMSQILNIEYCGIHYTASVDMIKDSVNHSIAKLQFDILLNEKKWLSDAEINKILLSRNI